MKEIELKIAISRETAAKLPSSPAVHRFGEGEAAVRHLRTLYLDTAGHALARAGIALRLRHGEAEGAGSCGWCQTVKMRAARTGAFSEAVESTVAIEAPEADPAAIPDEELRAAVLACLGNAAPAPVFETDIRHTARRLRLPGLGLVDLALDEGEIRADGRAEPVLEAEIELLEGSPRTVFEAARQLFPAGGARPARASKADRGAALALGAADPDARPRNAEPVALPEGANTEQGARAVLAECLDQVAANVSSCLLSDDPEGPHQLRVGLRRLRTAILVFAPALGGDALGRLDAEARWLSHEAGRVRDLDVALADILRPLIGEGVPEPGLAALERELADHAARARETLRRGLAGPRAWALLVDLGELIAGRGWLDPGDWDQTARLAAPLHDTAAAALEARRAKALKRGERIATLSVEARHDLRKELKKLRYATEFLSPLYPDKAVKPFLKRLKEMQAVFGALQDATMAEALFRAEGAPGSGDVATARAAGYVLGVHAERARRSWEDAKGAWKAFREVAPFWR